MNQVVTYISSSLAMTLQQLCLMLGPLCLLGVALHFLSSALRHQSAKLTGKWFYIWLTFPGTVVHELSHAIMCLVFFHKITDMKLFHPASDGTLGYVKHTYNPRNLYQRSGNFFIATAPLWFGALVIYGLARWLLSDEVLSPITQVSLNASEFTSWSGLSSVSAKMFEAMLASSQALLATISDKPWHLAGFLYASLAVAGHVTLSPPDLRGAFFGLAACVLLLFIINICTLWIGDFMMKASFSVVRVSIVLYIILFYTMIITGIAAAGFWSLNKLVFKK